MSDGDLNVVGTTPKPSGNKVNSKVVVALVGIVVLAIGVVAGILLLNQRQDIREKASCTAQCPADSDRSLLVSCVPDEDGSFNSTCNLAGRVAVCGNNASSAREYCCPSVGGNWTTNMSLCPASSTNSPTPTATATSSSTASPSSTKTATPTATSTATGSAQKTASPTAKPTKTPVQTSAPEDEDDEDSTPYPVPETGAELPTILGIVAGAVVIIASLILAI